MDLSHLATIGLFRPKGRAPLSTVDMDYFKQHGVEDVLSQIIHDLAAHKPAEPFKFIAEAVSQCGRTAATPVKAPAKATAPAKAAAPAPGVAPAGDGGDQAQIDAVGNQIRDLKEKLKSEGLAGKKINDHPEVKALVEKLQALKSGAAPAAAPAAPVAEKKAEKKRESSLRRKSKSSTKGEGQAKRSVKAFEGRRYGCEESRQCAFVV